MSLDQWFETFVPFFFFFFKLVFGSGKRNAPQRNLGSIHPTPLFLLGSRYLLLGNAYSQNDVSSPTRSGLAPSGAINHTSPTTGEGMRSKRTYYPGRAQQR